MVRVKGDKNFEDDETFGVNLSNPTNATLGASTGVGTILNDDTASADLEITKTAVPASYQAGSFFNYSIVVNNKGPDTAQSVVLTRSTSIYVDLRVLPGGRRWYLQ